MIKYYDIEALSNIVRYAIRGTYLFGEDQIVVEYVMYINGSIFGNEILQYFTDDVPDFIDDAYICVKGDLEIDIDEEFGNVEEIRVFNSNGKIVFCCYDAEVLQQYLVGVEIVGVENRG